MAFGAPVVPDEKKMKTGVLFPPEPVQHRMGRPGPPYPVDFTRPHDDIHQARLEKRREIAALRRQRRHDHARIQQVQKGADRGGVESPHQGDHVARGQPGHIRRGVTQDVTGGQRAVSADKKRPVRLLEIADQALQKAHQTPPMRKVWPLIMAP
jgi:hypothetical protein